MDVEIVMGVPARIVKVRGGGGGGGGGCGAALEPRGSLVAPAELAGAALGLDPVFEATALEALASGVGEADVRSVVGLGEGDG